MLQINYKKKFNLSDEKICEILQNANFFFMKTKKNETKEIIVVKNVKTIFEKENLLHLIELNDDKNCSEKFKKAIFSVFISCIYLILLFTVIPLQRDACV